MVSEVPNAQRLMLASGLGFGAYRIWPHNAAHRSALHQALDFGCTLIDTASNYTDGGSEEVIGEVLLGHPGSGNVAVITKIGYISPSMLDHLVGCGINVEYLPEISSESRYSLRPDVIQVQLQVSRSRLRREYLDAVLLHNPEHLFRDGFEDDRAWGEIRRSLELLEDQVARRLIGRYGVSSNILKPNGSNFLERLFSVAKSVSSTNHFSVVQFPFNLLERELAEQFDGGKFSGSPSKDDIIAIGNRPISSMGIQGPIRLVDSYHASECDNDKFEECVKLVNQALDEGDIPHQASEFAVIQFLRDNRHGVDDPELLDAIFNKHVWPFVSDLCGAEPITSTHMAFVRLHQSLRQQIVFKICGGGGIRSRLIDEGLVDRDDTRPLQVIACEHGLISGLNHVLVGMRRPEYVSDLRTLLPGAASK